MSGEERRKTQGAGERLLPFQILGALPKSRGPVVRGACSVLMQGWPRAVMKTLELEAENTRELGRNLDVPMLWHQAVKDGTLRVQGAQRAQLQACSVPGTGMKATTAPSVLFLTEPSFHGHLSWVYTPIDDSLTDFALHVTYDKFFTQEGASPHRTGSELDFGLSAFAACSLKNRMCSNFTSVVQSPVLGCPENLPVTVTPL